LINTERIQVFFITVFFFKNFQQQSRRFDNKTVPLSKHNRNFALENNAREGNFALEDMKISPRTLLRYIETWHREGRNFTLRRELCYGGYEL
jgi:hypothetical protein